MGADLRSSVNERLCLNSFEVSAKFRKIFELG